MGGVDGLTGGDGAVAWDRLSIGVGGDWTAASRASKTPIAAAGGWTAEEGPSIGGAVAGLEAAALAWKLRSPTSLAPRASPD
ncbi:MAG TPA: hypothetical protein VKG91_07840 [Roseiarcus sp.]|nr:hypothetical protein [Roseiarcus sp.]